MKKALLPVLISSSVFAVGLNPVMGAEQQNKISDEVVGIKDVIASQQQKINEIESANQQLLNSLQQQNTEYQAQNQQMTQQISELEKELDSVSTKLIKSNQSLSELQAATQSANQGLKVDINKLSADTAASTTDLDQKLSSRSLLGLLSLLSLLGLVAGIYWYLRKQQSQQSESLANKVQSALEGIKKAEENIVESDTKLVAQLNEVLAQIKLERDELIQAQALSATNSGNAVSSDDGDHSLATKLADEMHRMRRRINALPEGTKGLKALSKSLERLEEELEEKGYEIIDYTGMDYIEGMTLKARFIPSDELDDGQSVITRVVYPQVNFNGKLIQQADVEVSVG